MVISQSISCVVEISLAKLSARAGTDGHRQNDRLSAARAHQAGARQARALSCKFLLAHMVHSVVEIEHHIIALYNAALVYNKTISWGNRI